MVWVVVELGCVVLALACLAGMLARRYAIASRRALQLADESEASRQRLAGVYAVIDGFGGGVDERVRDLVALKTLLCRDAPELLVVLPALLRTLDANLRFLQALRGLRRPVHPWIRRLGLADRSDAVLFRSKDSDDDFLD